MSPIEIAAVIASAIGIWLTTQRKLIAWPITLLACFLYAEVFREARLYSDMLLQGVYAAFCVYGWWHWARGVREEGSVRVARMHWHGCAAGLAAGAAASVLLGFLMARYTNAAIPRMDATLTTFSLVAQWWTTQKYLANWLLWIVIDVLYTAVFVYKKLYLTAGLYAFFVWLAIVGLRAWKASLKEAAA